MGVGVFTNVPGPEYVEEELEYSVPEMIENLEEWKRFNTLTEEGLLQKGLIPIWLKNFWWQKVDISNQVYFNRDINGNFGYTRNIDIYKDVIRIMGTANELFPYEKENRYLDDKMIKLFKDNKVHPFLLFINKCFVPWSKIRIVKVDELVTFIIDRYRKLPVDSLTILHIPFRRLRSCMSFLFSWKYSFLFDRFRLPARVLPGEIPVLQLIFPTAGWSAYSRPAQCARSSCGVCRSAH